MTRILLTAAMLALRFIGPAAAQQAWPDLADNNSWTFVGNRVSFPVQVFATNRGTHSYLTHTVQASPPYAVKGIRLAYANFYVTNGGGYPVENCPGNPLTIDFATVFVGGTTGNQVTEKTAYPVTFGGSLSAKVGDCEFIWSDPLRDGSGNLVSIPAGTVLAVRQGRSVIAGENIVSNTSYNLKPYYETIGEGLEFSNGPQTGKRLSGTVGATSNRSDTPATMIGQGWDGSPVYLVVGDSIGASQADIDLTDPRGMAGYVSRALDDSGSIRRNFAMWAIPGTRPQQQSTVATGEFKLRMRLLRSTPNKPFNRIFSEMGQNGIDPLPTFQAEMRDWWSFWRWTCPTCPIYQTTFMPHAGQINSSYWTDSVNQNPTGAVDKPSGYRDAANAWLRSGLGLPSHVTVVDPVAPVQDAAEPQKWRTLSGSWTVGSAGGSGATIITLAGATAPSNGDWYVFERGTTNAETRQAWAVSGTGPWTISLTSGTGKPHASGTTVLRAPTGDGTHPGSSGHKAAAQVLISKKQDGTIR